MRIDDQLLYLRSAKLSLLIYMNNIGKDCVELHKAMVKDGKLNISIKVYDLKVMNQAEKKSTTRSLH